MVYTRKTLSQAGRNTIFPSGGVRLFNETTLFTLLPYILPFLFTHIFSCIHTYSISPGPVFSLRSFNMNIHQSTNATTNNISLGFEIKSASEPLAHISDTPRIFGYIPSVWTFLWSSSDLPRECWDSSLKQVVRALAPSWRSERWKWSGLIVTDYEAPQENVGDILGSQGDEYEYDFHGMSRRVIW